MMDIIRTHALTKQYRLGSAAVPALQEITLNVAAGEFTALAGPSGSGKSTLLNLIGCLDKPDAGHLFLEDEDVTAHSLNRLARLRRRRLGFVFQRFNLIPVLSTYENVEYPLLLGKCPARERRRRVLDLLERVGLQDRKNHRPNQLSGGQQQRVAIARALVTDPVIVLADEPTANLDSQTGAGIVALMHQLNREEQITFLFATHDPRVFQQADRVLQLEDGRMKTIQSEYQSTEVCHV